MPEVRPVAGSYREEGSRVFRAGGRVVRFLDADTARAWRVLSGASFWELGQKTGSIVSTWEPGDAQDLVRQGGGPWVTAVEHEPVPAVTYPYEWPFPMLRRAAMLQLDLLLAALGDGFLAEDATPYNIQWKDGHPVFIDVTSFRRHEEGDTWQGYRQFCQLYLYPLLIEAYRDIPYQSFLRGNIEGIEPEVMARLLGWRDMLRRGVLTHVFLHASLSRTAAGRNGDLRGAISDSGFSSEAIRTNLRRLRYLVETLRSRRTDSVWTAYDESESYCGESWAEKQEVVARWVAQRQWDTVWDVGANRGVFSRMAAEHARCVLALDSDEAVCGAHYEQLTQGGPRNVLPLVYRFHDPSPAMGWHLRERPPLAHRARPDLTLLLAVVHHLCITANIPVQALVDAIADLGGTVIVEFVAKDDPQAKRLLQNKRKAHAEYTKEHFEAALARRFRIAAAHPLPSGTRTLYLAEPHSS